MKIGDRPEALGMIQAIQKKAATTEVMTAHFLSAEDSPTND
jgi:hypothetical protein